MFLENHVEGVTFQPHEPGYTVETRVDAAAPVPDESHFFVAVCAHRPQVGNPTFLYVPRVANVLRERERHIAKLEGELATKDQWLDKAQLDLAEFDREHQKLLVMFREQKEELERSNRWAEELNASLLARGERIAELQEELARDQENARQVVAGFNTKIAGAGAGGSREDAMGAQPERRDPPAWRCAQRDQRHPGTDHEGPAGALRAGPSAGG